MTEINFGLRSAESVRLARYGGQEQWSMDGNGSPSTMTEMNFGLRSAESVRLA